MSGGPARVLLVGPYDPHCGEYTFLSPPLGVWRLAGVLGADGVPAEVFDPNCCTGPPEEAFDRLLSSFRPDVVGFSTTGMTLRFDLALAHRGRAALPDALLLAGGMEATFDPETAFALGPFDRVVLGEGERPLREIARRLSAGEPLDGIAGTAWQNPDGSLSRSSQPPLSREELSQSIFRVPYERMPYPAYWERLADAYRVHDLPMKADREARLAEIRSVRLITLNYCPMNCTFCSSTNFLNAAQGGVAKLARLDADECVQMVEHIVGLYPDVRTIIFQDDIFVFTADDRILPLCEKIVDAKRKGSFPEHLQFISTNRIDALSSDRLEAMSRAGFRVLGFGIENFSLPVLKEFNKARIHPHIETRLQEALALGITPFLDMIMTSPRCSMEDLAENMRQAYRWVVAGCEVGMYPYVIPFSGAAMATDPALVPHTITAERKVAGTDVTWDQPVKILPVDPEVRAAIVRIEAAFETHLAELSEEVAHLPSRVRSLLWIHCSLPVLEAARCAVPDPAHVLDSLLRRLPQGQGPARERLRARLREPSTLRVPR